MTTSTTNDLKLVDVKIDPNGLTYLIESHRGTFVLPKFILTGISWVHDPSASGNAFVRQLVSMLTIIFNRNLKLRSLSSYSDNMGSEYCWKYFVADEGYMIQTPIGEFYYIFSSSEIFFYLPLKRKEDELVA